VRNPRISTIQHKLGLILLATVGVALLIAAAAMLLVQARKEWRDARAELSAQADIVGLASEAALAFEDPVVGEHNLRALVGQPAVIAAALYDAKGLLFASFRGRAAEGTVPQSARGEALHFDWRTASVVRPVLSNRETIGYVYVQSRHALVPALLEYAGWLVAVTLASLAGALLLAQRLQRSVTGPIEEVSAVARAVLERGSFDMRATRRSDDEVGQLVDAFNTMLDEIGRRARVLEDANAALSTSEALLQQSNRAKDEFLATLAHELRNPLAPLRTGVQILKRSSVLEQVARRTLETMDRQLTHMVRLIDDLLDISRINSGKIRLERKPASLRRALQTALELSRPAIDAAGHALQVELGEDDLEVLGDETRLAQAFGNLLNNAAKYTPAGGQICLRLSSLGSNAVVEVQDTGVGIPANMLDTVFQLFAQVDSPGAPAGGLGIGLFLVRSLVEMHGGKVEARSEGNGQGSTFTVRLPTLQRPSLTPMASTNHESSNMNSHSAVRVLVVDDNVDAAETLVTFLDLLGAQARAVHTGAAAVPAALELAPHLVLLDIGLPDTSGYEVARALRREASLARTQLVALTGWGAEEDRRRAMDAGFDRHLTKPVDLSVLEDMLRELHVQPDA
jgi:signal transduction histidine kinase/ActR/RegA family two-component response regulator